MGESVGRSGYIWMGVFRANYGEQFRETVICLLLAGKLNRVVGISEEKLDIF